MIIPADEQFIRRAIRLAMNGRGHVEPNPMVACVLVKDGRVIGEGHHAKFGGPHAEPTALGACTESPEGATAYVTLEPCCHTNKKTPPCAPRLIEAKVKRVVIGCLDPNPDVDGKGVAMLRAAGITVDGPVLEAEAKQLLAPFTLRTQVGRPYVTLKWAQTADGKIAGPHGARLQISNARSSAAVHALRARSDAILVGINTVIADDPLLTARDVATSRPLTRIVLDSNLLLPETSQLVRTAREQPVVVACRSAAFAPYHRGDRRLVDLAQSGVRFLQMSEAETIGGRISVHSFFALLTADTYESLGLRSFTHVLVEPGPTLTDTFLRENLADRVWVIRSPKRVDDNTAPAAAPVPAGYVVSGHLTLGDDVLTEYLNPASPAFFAAVPSADLVLAGGGSVG